MEHFGFALAVLSVGATTIPDSLLLVRGVYLCVVNSILVMSLFNPVIAKTPHVQLGAAVAVIVSFWATMVRLDVITQQ